MDSADSFGSHECDVDSQTYVDRSTEGVEKLERYDDYEAGLPNRACRTWITSPICDRSPDVEKTDTVEILKVNQRENKAVTRQIVAKRVEFCCIYLNLLVFTCIYLNLRCLERA